MKPEVEAVVYPLYMCGFVALSLAIEELDKNKKFLQCKSGVFDRNEFKESAAK